jgi:hypothetical protein
LLEQRFHLAEGAQRADRSWAYIPADPSPQTTWREGIDVIGPFPVDAP